MLSSQRTCAPALAAVRIRPRTCASWCFAYVNEHGRTHAALENFRQRLQRVVSESTSKESLAEVGTAFQQSLVTWTYTHKPSVWELA
jgi:hypothetical protein